MNYDPAAPSRKGMLRPYAGWIGAFVIAALACVLYARFLGNPIIFDDQYLFLGSKFSYYATHPIGLGLRLPAYFSLAVPEVLWGTRGAHRIVSLAFHIACSLALFKLLYDLLRLARPTASSPVGDDGRLEAATWAFFGAAVFAIHPMAVYAAAYLVQRTIVVATLFSVLSVVLFLRGLTSRRYADALSAALMYSLAVLSKEHSILVPAAAVLTVALANADRRFATRYSALYWAACAPAAIFVVLLARGVIGQAYEPDLRAVAAQMEDFGYDVANFPWPVSAVTQAGLFFRYVFLWLWPDTGSMAIDLRVDYREGWSAPWILLKVSAFAAWGILGFVLLRRGRVARMAGIGVLYTWIVFLVELSAIRIQEPFVLYRSYLWAPGILIAAVALLSGIVSHRKALPAFAVVGAVLLVQANDRLVTFSKPVLLWEDAVAKLAAKPAPWGSRPLYNLGKAYLYDGQAEKAIEISERCVALYPSAFHCPFARGAIHLHLEQFDLALPYLTRALELRPTSGVTHHHIGVVLERLGRVRDAAAEYRRAGELGFSAGSLQLRRLEESHGELLRVQKAGTAKR